jgi:Flp pilus assembly protein TadG
MPQARRHRRSRGQSLAEITLAMPLLLGLTLGVADGGRAFAYREAVTNAARQALRVAVSDSSDGNLACAGTGAVTRTAHVPWVTGDPTYLVAIATAAALESSTNGAAAGSRIAGATITVTWHCKTALAVTNATNGGITDPSDTTSDAIDVSVSYGLTLLTPMAGRLFGSGTPVIAAQVIGRAEY